MRCLRAGLLLAPTLVVACAGNPDKRTLAELRGVEPDVADVRVENGLEQAMLAYRKYLDEAPESSLTPEAMRRLADLKLEQQYGILGDGDLVELPAPEVSALAGVGGAEAPIRGPAVDVARHSESEQDFERRVAREAEMPPANASDDLPLPGDEDVAWAGPLEAIALYDEILETYPGYPHNDRVLYQKARAYDELGLTDEGIAVIERLIGEYPHSRYIDEVQFRRAEYFFVRRKYLDAEEAYAAITEMGAGSEYYELALYKLGWALYKQELHEEALEQYIALLDYKVSIGYDFDQSENEADARRTADTFRVISLSFSSVGGPQAVASYFAAVGRRSYEDRVYSHLGEFYLEKLRYHDAATVYETFVGLYPLHRVSPHFGMRVVEIYEAGGFPKLVLESKKDFAGRYALQSEYWSYFDVEESPEILRYLKGNLEDLANHYHALFQNAEQVDEKPANFEEASRWYRAYLASFSEAPEAPGIHHQLADLLLEHQDFGEAARQYELTAYEYPPHERSAEAGYAAIYAHREHQKAASVSDQDAVQREAVASTLRFVEVFPKHEHAAAVLGAAVDDLYDMKQFEPAIATGRRLIESYPESEPSIRRSAWAVIAHASFDLADFEPAEQAYARVLEMTPTDDDSRQDVVDNLAASIYKQGEQASLAGEHRLAADHFLRITRAAPDSDIRPVAEYDAGAALIRLEDWAGAAAVLEAFRQSHPEHALHREATKQMAFVYREEGNLLRAAEEYERVAREAEESELRREALLLAGELYEDSEAVDRAVAAYLEYVRLFPRPLELAVETRFTIAELHQAAGDDAGHREQLQKIVKIDAGAGDERTDRIRYLAARSALVLAEPVYERFEQIELVQPFERSLQAKQRRMDEALEAFGDLVDYEVGEVTAAATFYMAELYRDFSLALIKSERPSGLDSREMQQYEMVLEEEAYPFEERAIEVHEKNLELMSAGVYNSWVERSLEKLAVMMPGRYAKFEASSGLIASIDTYAYRAPNVRGPAAGAAVRDEPGESGEPASLPAAGPDAAPSEAVPTGAGLEAG